MALNLGLALAGGMAVIGHNWSFLNGFKGGAGGITTAATSANTTAGVLTAGVTVESGGAEAFAAYASGLTAASTSASTSTGTLTAAGDAAAGLGEKAAVTVGVAKAAAGPINASASSRTRALSCTIAPKRIQFANISFIPKYIRKSSALALAWKNLLKTKHYHSEKRVEADVRFCAANQVCSPMNGQARLPCKNRTPQFCLLIGPKLTQTIALRGECTSLPRSPERISRAHAKRRISWIKRIYPCPLVVIGLPLLNHFQMNRQKWATKRQKP
jgi:hypothetical protein